MAEPDLAAMIAAVHEAAETECWRRAWWGYPADQPTRHVTALRAAHAVLKGLAAEPTPEMLSPYKGLYRTRISESVAKEIWLGMRAALLARIMVGVADHQ